MQYHWKTPTCDGNTLASNGEMNCLSSRWKNIPFLYANALQGEKCLMSSPHRINQL